MMLTARTVLNTNVATLAQMRAHLARVTDLSGNDIDEIATGYFEYGAVFGISADGALAQCLHETNNLHFGGQVSASQHNMAGIGATNDGAAGLSWPTWRAGIRAHFIHLLAWCGQPAGDEDPRISQVKAAIRQQGKVITWRDLGGRWAVPGDGYADGIERHWQAIVGETGATTVSVPKPPMTILDSPNRDGYSGTRRVDAIVLHITQGTDSRGWLTSPQSKASANYLIERDGTIYQLVPPDHDAWANGAVNQPDTSNPLIAKWLTERDSQGQPINFNQRTVSIEHEGMSSNNIGGSLTPAQVTSTVALQAWLCAICNIPPDQDHILGHYQIDNVNRHFCPGFSAKEWANWMAQVAALVAGSPAPANNNPGFPGAIGPRGNLVLNGVDFGGGEGSPIVTVEVIQAQVRNDQGARYHIGWQQYAVGPWQLGPLDAPGPAPDPAPTPPPDPQPAPTPPPAPGGTMQLHDHGDIPLAKPEPNGGQVVDPASGQLAEVFADTHVDYALAIWWQPKGWLPVIKYQTIIPGRWLRSVALAVHEGHLKVRLIHSPVNQDAPLRDHWLDLGAVSAL